MGSNLKEAFTSKKFLATVIGAVTIALGTAFGLSEDQSAKIAAMICAYVVGQGISDQGKEKEKIAAKLKGKSAAEKAAALEAEI
jgi:hypothetical protein